MHIRLVPRELVPLHGSLIQRRRQGRQPIYQHVRRALLLQICRQPILTLLLDLHQLLASLSTQLQYLIVRGRFASHAQQSDYIALRYRTQLRISATHIPLPVWVVCNVRGGYGSWVRVGRWVETARSGVAELGVERNTGGAVGVNCEDTVD